MFERLRTDYRVCFLPLIFCTGCLVFLAFFPNSFDTERYWLDWTGKTIFSTGHVPYSIGNESPLAVGSPWITCEWLFAVFVTWMRTHHFIFILWMSLGVGSAGLLWYMTWRCIQRNISPFYTFLLVLIGGVILLSRFEIRAESLADGLMAITLFIVMSKKYTWLLLPTMLLWTNIHASFATGCIIIGIFMIRDFREKNITRGFLSLVAMGTSFITPYGYHQWIYVLTITHAWIIGYIAEWTPSVLAMPIFGLFFLGCIAFIVLNMYRTRHIQYTHLLALLLLYEGASANRFVYLAFIVAIPEILPELLSFFSLQSLETVSKSSRRISIISAEIIFSLLVFINIFTYPPALERRVWSSPFQDFIYQSTQNLINVMPLLREKGDLVMCPFGPSCNIALDMGVQTFDDGRVNPFPSYLRISEISFLQKPQETSPLVGAIIFPSGEKGSYIDKNFHSLLPEKNFFQVYQRKGKLPRFKKQ